METLGLVEMEYHHINGMTRKLHPVHPRPAEFVGDWPLTFSGMFEPSPPADMAKHRDWLANYERGERKS